MASWVERQLVNRAVRIGVRLGRDIDGLQELEVAGRRTGKPRRVPLKVLEIDGERYLVSLSGSSGWVCNLRTRRSARLRIGRRVEHVVGVELDDRDKLPILQTYLAGVTRLETRRRLEWAAAGLPEADVQRQAAKFPVFRLARTSEDG